MRAHDPGALLVRKRIPGALLRHRVDDDVGRVPDGTRLGAAVLATGVGMLAEIRRAAARREIRIRPCAVCPELRSGEPRFKIADIGQLVGHAPQQHVSVGARTDERVGVHADRRVSRGAGELVLV